MAGPSTGRWAPRSLPVVVIGLMVVLACGLGGCAAQNDPGAPAETQNLVVDLQSLQPSVGGLSPSFHPVDTSYMVMVGPSTGEVTLTAVTTDPRASLTINSQPAVSGQPFGPLTLSGLTTVVPIVVEAFGVSKDYQVTIVRGTTPDLQNLTASAGALSPAFDPATLPYTVTTGFNTSSTTVTATVADTTATLKINGSSATSGVASSPIALNPGSTIIPVEVTASNDQKKTYQVTVIRGNTADLANLQTSAGPIAPVFSPSVQSYTASTGNSTTQATITVTPADSTATITINNQAAQANQAAGPFNLNVGPNTFTIVVTAGSAGSKTYTLVITRTPADTDASLTNLAVSAGALNPGFSSGTTTYTVNVPNSTTSTTVTATVSKSTSSLTINGNSATSGQAAGPFPLNVGPNLFTVLVTAQSGATQQYQVTITRSQPPCAATLTNLTVSPGAIAFNPSVPAYQVNVGDTVGSLTVTASPQAGTTVTINGQVTTSRSVTLNPPGSATTITVVVQCPDGSTTTYTITVNRANTPCIPNLGNLTLSAGSISFTPSQTTYAITVPNSTASTTVTATLPAGSLSTLRINGQTVSSGQTVGPINLTVGVNTIQVVVICADGTTRTYSVTITRQDLACTPSKPTNLDVSPKSGPVDGTTAGWSVAVAATTAQVTVTASVPAPATLRINGQVTNSLQVNLNPAGQSTSVPVVVTCPDGKSQAFTLTIIRAAAPSSNATLASFRAFEDTKLGTAIALTLSAPTFECTVNGNCLYTGSTGAFRVRITATKSDANALLRILGPGDCRMGVCDVAAAGDPTAEATLSFQNNCGSPALTIRLEVTAQMG